jgi:transposase
VNTPKGWKIKLIAGGVMMVGRRKTYTREFKQDAVRLVLEKEVPVSQAALDLGIHENSIYRWLKQYGEAPQEALKPRDEELRRLQRENEVLKEEREILKKALAIFSKRRR